MSEQDIKINSEKIKKEVRWWSYAAWTLPLTALAGLFFFQVLGWESLVDKFLAIGATVMFGIGVFWWWWAIYKIFNFADMMSKTADRLENMKNEFKRIKDNLK